MPEISVPQNYRIVLAVTSFWILIPLSHAKMLDMVLMFSVMAASLLHWTFYRHKSLFHTIDVVCASVMILKVAIQTLSPAMLCAHIIMLYIFLRGRMHMQEGAYQKHLAYHLLFRLIVFWILCAYVKMQISPRLFCLMTFAYYAHVRTTLWMCPILYHHAARLACVVMVR